MFGWDAGYVKHTRKAIDIVRVNKSVKVLVPKKNVTPYEPFLPYITAKEPDKPIKSRHKRKLFYLKVGEKGFYLKKYSYRFTRRHYAPLRGFIWTIPIAQRQMHKMLFLRNCGAGVAKPVMTLIRRYGALKHESLLVMQECPGKLLKQFLNEVDDFGRRLNIIAQTFRFLQISHSNNIHHGDLATHNFMVTPEDELRAIDLDERKTKWLGPLGNKRELKKWVTKSKGILNLADENGSSQKNSDFEHMLEKNYPDALNYS